eukprot:g9631.t1
MQNFFKETVKTRRKVTRYGLQAPARCLVVSLSYASAAKPPLPAATQEDIYHREVSTSLNLQLLLYFGFWFKVFFALTLLAAAWYKSRWIEKVPLAIAVLLLEFAFVFLLEPFRYFLGYRGNLSENVPHLFLFLILTVFPGILIEIFLLIAPDVLPELGADAECHPRCVLSLEKALVYVDVVFLCLQFLFGVGALRALIAKNTTEFYLMQDENVMAAFAEGGGGGGGNNSPTARLRRAFSSSGGS